jgi:hypothetical protein
METSKEIKIMLIMRNKKAKDLAKLLKIHPQSMSRKMSKNIFTQKELHKIAKYLNAKYIPPTQPARWFILNDTEETT